MAKLTKRLNKFMDKIIIIIIISLSNNYFVNFIIVLLIMLKYLWLVGRTR
jgi:hypothetical protein